MTPAFSLLFLLTLPGLYASAQTITLFGVSEPLSSAPFVVEASVTFSAGGTNSAGDTTFVEVIGITSVVHQPDTKITPISVPTTITETFVYGASGYIASMVFPDSVVVQESCGFGSDGAGTCVISATESLDDSTYSGSVVPIFTLTAPPSQATQTSTSSHSASQTGGAMTHGAFTVWNVLAVGTAALFHALY